jgi:hypothetical protein
MMRHFYNVIVLSMLLGAIQCNTALAAATNSKNGIQYITGGVGHDEVLSMRTHAKNFSLNLMFSEGLAGQAVTDVNVNIYDENSTLVFRVKGAKPLLYVNLPTGTYTILANNSGAKLRHKINITEGSSQKVILNWKNEALDSRDTTDTVQTSPTNN